MLLFVSDPQHVWQPAIGRTDYDKWVRVRRRCDSWINGDTVDPTSNKEKLREVFALPCTCARLAVAPRDAESAHVHSQSRNLHTFLHDKQLARQHMTSSSHDGRGEGMGGWRVGGSQAATCLPPTLVALDLDQWVWHFSDLESTQRNAPVWSSARRAARGALPLRTGPRHPCTGPGLLWTQPFSQCRPKRLPYALPGRSLVPSETPHCHLRLPNRPLRLPNRPLQCPPARPGETSVSWGYSPVHHLVRLP